MKRLALLISFSILLLGFLYLYSNEPWLLLPEHFGPVHAVLFFVLIASMIVVALFNHSRIFFILLLFLGTAINIEFFEYLRHTNELFHETSDAGYLSDAYILLIFPLYIAFFTFFDEKGIFTPSGLIRLGVTFFTIFILDFFVFLPQYAPFEMGCSSCGFVLLPHLIPLYISTNLNLIAPLALLIIGAIRNTSLEGIYFLAWLAAIGAALSSRTLDVFILFATSYALLSVMFILSHSYMIAFIDELTNIKGRRAMTEALKTLSNDYTLVMCDIDHFKSFNDTHGHDIGDEVLKLVASELNNVAGGGKAFRWGGEEFVLLFNNKDIKHAKPYVETVRQNIEKRPFILRTKDRPSHTDKERYSKAVPNEQKLFVTMSFGMAQRKEKQLPKDVLKEADNALYKAKKAGRNCVRS